MTKIHRSTYRAQIKAGKEEDALTRLRRSAQNLKLGFETGDLMTTSLFRWGLHLFVYWESIGQEIRPEALWGDTSEFLESWHGGANPQPPQARCFVPMMDIFHWLAPESVEHWRRKAVAEHIQARVARLQPEMVSSYIFFHYQLQEEKPGSVDKYGIISLHENLIFFYQEMPAIVEEPPRSGKLNTHNTPPDWHGTMFPHFMLWEDAPAGQEIWRDVETLFHFVAG